MQPSIPRFSTSLDDGPSQEHIDRFVSWLWIWYRDNRRLFVWRESISPYMVFVSEVMLQQTQTTRVAAKILDFLAQFGSFDLLARASNAEILLAWQGFGYNRRALYLRDAAAMIVNQFDGILPDEPEVLQQLPGIGPATAASICAYAYDRRVLFVETNIRTVLLYVFFGDEEERVSDRLLLKIMEQLVPKEHVREWYYAMTDLGVLIKKLYGNHNRRSAAYTRQSRFEGSRRQVRGMVIRALLDQPYQTTDSLAMLLQKPYKIVAAVVDELYRESHIQQRQDLWFI